MRDKLAFRLSDKYYAIETTSIHGIIEARDLYFLPGRKGSLRGVVSLRGETVTVLDASLLQGVPPKGGRKPGRVIVIKEDNQYIGIDLGDADIFFIWGAQREAEDNPEAGTTRLNAAAPTNRADPFSSLKTLSPDVEVKDVPCKAVFTLAEKMLVPGRREAVIADDNAFYRASMRGILKAGGFDVLAEADNGEKALEFTKRHNPSLVVLDLVMPVKNGLEATREIKALAEAPRVIICSSLRDERIIKEAEEAGADAYITKPFTSREMLEPALDLSARPGA